MKRLFLIFTSILVIAGCAKDYTEDIASIEKNWTTEQGGSDDPVIFPSEIDYDSFAAIEGLSLRFKACAVPGNILNEKTTRALGLSILHYPMNYIIFAYNYYDMPVRIVYDHSPLHRELAARNDAAEALVGVFEKTRIDKSLEMMAKDYENITLADELFLEYFLGSGLVKGLDKGNNKKRLAEAVKMKRDRRLADPDLNNALTLMPLAYMSERLGLGVQFSKDIVDNMHSFTQGDAPFK
jgi:hypothetical protein